MKHPFVVLSLGGSLLIPQFAATLHADQNGAAVKPEQVPAKKQNETMLDQVVVTANRYETPTGEVGSSISVITAKEIEQSKKTTVQEVLRNVPGLDVVQTGNAGGTTSVYMRGASPEHTLVLLDGVEMNDPSNTGGVYNFANLTTNNIERIEVLRGPQSTLYGAHAMGGVINIITKRGKGKPSGFASAEGGSYNTAKERAGVSGGTDLVNYSLGVSRLDTGGFSYYGEKYGAKERDGYQNTSVNSRIGLTPLDNLNIDFILNYVKSRAALDPTTADNSSYYMRTEQLTFRSQADLSLLNDLWEQKLGVSLNDTTNEYTSYTTTKNYPASDYHGQTVKIDWQHILNLHKTNTLTFGADRKEENMHSASSNLSDKFASNTGVYVQDQVRLWDAWFTTAGVRVDDHSKFGTEATYRFTSAYDLRKSGTTFKGSYGTGFKAPSMYQLYSATGNQALQPEKSSGWDLGVEQAFTRIKTVVGATYFSNEFTNLIYFIKDASSSTGYRYVNINKARTQGVETFVTVKPVEDLTLKGSYTYTRAIDQSGNDLPRRPKNKFGLNANYSFMDRKANLNLGLVYVGTRMDSLAGQKMKDYVVVNLAATYDITKNIQLFGRVDNLFDRYYEEVNRMGTSRLAAYGGVKASF